MADKTSFVQKMAAKLGLNEEYMIPYGRDKAKVDLAALKEKHKNGRLILVSALTPTPAGEGKTTVSIGLAQGLQAIGKRVCLALREPSMGPVFGRKGGATGGGASSITPGESINLCFNGDFAAITSANNLLAAVVDNALFYHTTKLDPSKVTWKRVMDMNDRSLRNIVVGLRGNGITREDGFNITPASEIMACLCLAEDREDLRQRLDNIIVGFTAEDEAIYAREFGITDSLLAILRDAVNPNLVQTLEGVPAFVHGGPFANIAHGCNSVIATKLALSCAEYAVTEAGFAFDLGAEKFMDIKCRCSGLAPDAIVLVATIRALKMHGGMDKKQLDTPDAAAVRRGLPNLEAHIESARRFGRPVTVAINLFAATDTAEEIAVVQELCAQMGVNCAVANVFEKGGEGAKSSLKPSCRACRSTPRHSIRSTNWISRWKSGCVSSLRPSTGQRTLSSLAPHRRNSPFSIKTVSLPCPSAWQKLRTPSQTILLLSVVLLASPLPCAISRSLMALASSLLSAGTSCACLPCQKCPPPLPYVWMPQGASLA